MKSSEVMNLFSLEGKTALVTGACYGIGFAIATALHGAGAKIAFCATSDASVEKALKAYADQKGWAQKMLVNIAKAGFFSSDRTIEEYNNEIWHLA